MKNKPLVSICIPTYKRPEIVRETINSILTENLDNSLVDICITDNSATDETKDLMNSEFGNIINVHYKKTACPGFMNSIEALKYGDGEFLKLHNDYSKFKRGELQNLVQIIDKYKNKRPTIFFSMGALKKNKKIEAFNSFDDFMYDIHYYSTWSSAFGIWKNDLDRLILDEVDMDRMFPHTSLLFNMTNSVSYIVDDNEYVDNLPLKKKGGYNLPDNFVRLYLNMIKQLLCNKNISEKTYRKIEAGIIRFVAQWYSIVKYNRDIYSFSFDGDKKLIEDICGRDGVTKYLLWKEIYKIKYSLRKLVK